MDKLKGFVTNVSNVFLRNNFTLIKKITPPFLFIFFSRVLKKNIIFYEKWDLALKNSEGYNSEKLLKNLLNSAQLVIDGKIAFERDGVSFKNIEYNWELLSCLLFSLNEKKNVLLDFGGGFGSTYFQHKKFLSGKIKKWIILEQKGLVNLANSNLDYKPIYFVHDPKFIFKNKPTILLLSSVIHYLELPYEKLIELLNIETITYVIIDRTPFLNQPIDDKITVQFVKEKNYKASYPHWLFNEKIMLSFFEKKKFQIITQWEALGEKNQVFSHKGFFLSKKI
jgi:putative methyltransferase (TIGR04325 family)